MILELTAHTTSGPVIHTATVAGPEEALQEARRVLEEAMGHWTPEHEIGLRTAVQEAARSGQHTSGSMVVTLT
jgi:hypothetical protein